MRRVALYAGAVLALGALALPAVALDSETFDDYRSVGTAEDARTKPALLLFDGHAIEPTFSYKLGDIVTPHFYGAETLGYSDNVFDSPSPSQHSPYARTTVGGRGDIQVEEHVFSLGYRAMDSYYTNLDNRRNLLEQQGDIRLDLNFNDIKFHLDGIYQRLGYPGLVQVVGFAPEQVFQGQAWVEGVWNRFGAKLGVFARRDNFESTGEDFPLRAFDKKVVGLDAQINFRIQERLIALAEYDFETDLFDQPTSRDFDAHQFRVGMQGALGAKLAFSAKVGYTYQQLHGSSATFQDNKHYSGFNAACVLSWQVFPELTVSASYRHDLTWALSANFLEVDTVDLGAAYKFGPADKLTAKAGFVWSRANPDTGSHFDRIQCLAQLSYAIQKWLDVAVFYQYSQGLGNGAFVNSGYDEHRAGVSIAAGF